jgi:hypothetical protein
MNRSLALSLLLIPMVLVACKPPPPAPEGLDDASGFVIREFYSDDATFEAGLQGFMNWFYDEGERLVGLAPGQGEDDEPTESFTVQILEETDVAHLPESEFRDLAAAPGVVSLAEMECSWQVAEDFLVRGDQDSVFSTWEGYDRTYLSDEEAYNQATDDLIFSPVIQPLDPHGEEAFDMAAWSDTFMFSVNEANPAPQLGGQVDIEPYDLYFDMRHGVFNLTDQESGETTPTGVFAILTYITEPALDANDANGLQQQFSVEIAVERPGNKTLRMLAVWGEPKNNIGLDPDDPIILNGTVRISLEAAEELNVVCAEADDGSYEGSTGNNCNAAGDTPSALWLALFALFPILRRRSRA